MNTSNIEDDCFFRIDKSIAGYQIVSVQNFSHLIDLGLAMLNLSAVFGFKSFNQNNTMMLTVHFAQNTNSFDYNSSITSKCF